jgi:hypothetical protein
MESLVETRSLQWKDPELKNLMMIKFGMTPTDLNSEDLSKLKCDSVAYELIFGLLFYIDLTDGDKLKIVVPKDEKIKIMYDAHSQRYGAHLNREKVFKKLRQMFLEQDEE